MTPHRAAPQVFSFMLPNPWRTALIAAGAALAALAGCTGYSPQGLQAGRGEAQVRQHMGEPTGRHALPGGATRLEYARGPMGRHTYMIDLDAQGRLLQWEQVLDAWNFAQLSPGLPKAEVLRRVGRPAQTMRVHSGNEVWSWRHANYNCLWFQVEITPAGQVQSGASLGLDPECDINVPGAG